MSNVRNVICGMPCRALTRVNPRNRMSGNGALLTEAATKKSLPSNNRQAFATSVRNSDRPDRTPYSERITIGHPLFRPTMSLPDLKNNVTRQLDRKCGCRLFHGNARAKFMNAKVAKRDEHFFERTSCEINHYIEKPVGSLDLLDWSQMVRLSKRWPNKEDDDEVSSTFKSEVCGLFKEQLSLLKRMAEEHAANQFIGRWWWSHSASLSIVIARWRDETNSLLSPLEMFHFIDEIQKIDQHFQCTPSLIHKILHHAPSEDIEEIITTLELKETKTGVGTSENTLLYQEVVVDTDLYRTWLQALEDESKLFHESPSKDRAPDYFLNKMRNVVKRMWSQTEKGHYNAPPNTACYRFLFREWCRVQKTVAEEDSTLEFELLEEMTRRGIEFDSSIFGSVVSGWVDYCIKHAADKEPVQTFRELWKLMIRRGVQPATEEDNFVFLYAVLNRLPPPSDLFFLAHVVQSAHEEMKSAGVSVSLKTYDSYLASLAHVAILVRKEKPISRSERALIIENILAKMEHMILERSNDGIKMNPKAWNYYLRETFFSKSGDPPHYRTEFITQLVNNEKVGIPAESDFLNILKSYENEDMLLQVTLMVDRVKAFLETVIALGMTPSTEFFEWTIRIVLATGEKTLHNSYHQKGDEIVIINGIVWILSQMKRTGVSPNIQMFEQILEFCRKFYPNTPILEKVETTLSKMALGLGFGSEMEKLTRSSKVA